MVNRYPGPVAAHAESATPGNWGLLPQGHDTARQRKALPRATGGCCRRDTTRRASGKRCPPGRRAAPATPRPRHGQPLSRPGCPARDGITCGPGG